MKNESKIRTRFNKNCIQVESYEHLIVQEKVSYILDIEIR